MTTLRFLFAFLLLTWAVVVPASAQDTRGSLVPDAEVVLADGALVQAQDLRSGSLLKVWTAEKAWGQAKVTAVRRQHTDSYYLLKTARGELHATGSLRVAVAEGGLVRLDTLRVGDRILVPGAKGPEPAEVTSLRVLPATLVAYDLTIEGHLPFVAGGTLVAD